MQKTFRYNNADIFYRIEGEGKPVMLLHGFGEDSQIWDKQAEFLKEQYQIFLPDIPGSGNSGILQHVSEVAITDYADCMYALLQHENIAQIIMLGHSMGGYITLAFAEKYPGLLKAFGLIHSTAFGEDEEKKQNRLRSNKTIDQYGSYAFLKAAIPKLFSKKFKTKYPEKVKELIEQGKNFSKKALQEYNLAMMNRPDRTHVLRGSELPVFFVIGTEDVVAPLNDVLQQTHLPKTAYIHILENVAHEGMWEATEKVNQYLLNFISEIE